MNLGTLTQLFSAAFSKGKEKISDANEQKIFDPSDFQGPYPDRRCGCRGGHPRTHQQINFGFSRGQAVTQL